MFSWQMAAQIVLLALATIFMPAIIHVLAPGFASNPVQFDLTVSLARITFPYLILTLVAVQLSAMLNAISETILVRPRPGRICTNLGDDQSP